MEGVWRREGDTCNVINIQVINQYRRLYRQFYRLFRGCPSLEYFKPAIQGLKESGHSGLQDCGSGEDMSTRIFSSFQD